MKIGQFSQQMNQAQYNIQYENTNTQIFAHFAKFYGPLSTTLGLVLYHISTSLGLARLLLAAVAGAGARARTAAREARVRGEPGRTIVTAEATPRPGGFYRHRLQHCTELQPHCTAAVCSAHHCR